MPELLIELRIGRDQLEDTEQLLQFVFVQVKFVVLSNHERKVEREWLYALVVELVESFNHC